MNKRIAHGQLAPDFTAADSFGNTLKFKRPHASAHVLLVFLRYAGCPLCNLALDRLSVEYGLLKRNGCEVVVVIESTADTIQRNIHARHPKLPFRIIPDQKRTVYALYGVTPSASSIPYMVRNIPYWLTSVSKGYAQKEVDGNFFIVPAIFLINQRGKVVFNDYSANFYDDATFTPIYERLTFGI